MLVHANLDSPYRGHHRSADVGPRLPEGAIVHMGPVGGQSARIGLTVMRHNCPEGRVSSSADLGRDPRMLFVYWQSSIVSVP